MYIYNFIYYFMRYLRTSTDAWSTPDTRSLTDPD